MSDEVKTETRRGGEQGGPAFLIVVGVLMLFIIGMLAVLWSRERARRIEAEGDAQAAIEKLHKVESFLMKGMLGGGDAKAQLQSATAEALPRSKPVNREDLVPAAVTLDGRSREAFTISPAAGERMGFRGGDVIIVSPAGPTLHGQDAHATERPATATTQP